MHPAIGEFKTGSSNKITNSARHQHLVGIGQCGNSRCKMDSHSLGFLAPYLAFARMQSGPNTDTQIPGTIKYFLRTGNRTSRSIKSCVNAVSRPFD
jgi:hypothetical protein